MEIFNLSMAIGSTLGIQGLLFLFKFESKKEQFGTRLGVFLCWLFICFLGHIIENAWSVN